MKHMLILIIILLTTACGTVPLAQPKSNATAIIEVTAISPSPTSIPTVMATLTPTVIPTFTPSLTTTLSKLDENLQMIVFTVQNKQIYRVQVDKDGQPIGPSEQIDFPLDSRTAIHGLYPSPSGQYLAIWKLYGAGGTSVDILDISNGQLIPLFGKQPNVDPRVQFLDWAPNGQDVLVLGGTGNPALENKMLLVNIHSHAYTNIIVTQPNELSYITTASFSPNGKDIVYASQLPCSQCRSEVWLIALDSTNQQLLFEDSTAKIQDLLWSPNGNYIALVKWQVPSEHVSFAEGELYIMKMDGSGKRLLGFVTTHHEESFRPVWSPNSQKIAFVKSENVKIGKNLNELSSNIYVVDVSTGQKKPVTNFQNNQVLKPVWSPNGSEIISLASSDDTSIHFKLEISSLEDQITNNFKLDSTNFID